MVCMLVCGGLEGARGYGLFRGLAAGWSGGDWVGDGVSREVTWVWERRYGSTAILKGRERHHVDGNCLAASALAKMVKLVVDPLSRADQEHSLARPSCVVVGCWWCFVNPLTVKIRSDDINP